MFRHYLRAFVGGKKGPEIKKRGGEKKKRKKRQQLNLKKRGKKFFFPGMGGGHCKPFRTIPWFQIYLDKLGVVAGIAQDVRD